MREIGRASVDRLSLQELLAFLDEGDQFFVAPARVYETHLDLLHASCNLQFVVQSTLVECLLQFLFKSYRRVHGVSRRGG